MRLTKLKLRFYGDNVLRKRAKSVSEVTERERSVIAEMSEIMRLAGGIGLAAPQVGVNKQIILIDVGEGPCVFINPKIIRRSGCETKEEGCLSLPGVFVRVKRSKKITVSALDEQNEKILLVLDHLMARAVQHEMDHLKGKLLIDYASFFKKIKLRRQLKEFLKEKEGFLG